MNHYCRQKEDPAQRHQFEKQYHHTGSHLVDELIDPIHFHPMANIQAVQNQSQAYWMGQ